MSGLNIHRLLVYITDHDQSSLIITGQLYNRIVVFKVINTILLQIIKLLIKLSIKLFS